MWHRVSNGHFELPELPEGFNWELNYAVDTDVDLSWLGTVQRNRPSKSWYVDRKSGELINANSRYNDDLEKYVEQFGVHYVNYERNQYEFYIPSSNHNPPGRNWDHVEQEIKDAIIAKWGSLRRQDIEHMLEDHKLWEEYADNSRHMFVYQVKLLHKSETLTFHTIGGVDTDLNDDYTQEIFTELAHECIAEFLKDRHWWLDTENLHDAYLQKKDLLLTADKPYWDKIVRRFEAARAFRKLYNDGEDWWNYGARISEKLDTAKEADDAGPQNKSKRDSSD